MSIFFPYKISDVTTGIEQMFEINLSLLNEYQETMLTIAVNIYFFLIWFIIMYFALKGINWVYERLC